MGGARAMHGHMPDIVFVRKYHKSLRNIIKNSHMIIEKVRQQESVLFKNTQTKSSKTDYK